MQHRVAGWGLSGPLLLLALVAPLPVAASPGATLSLKPLLGAGDGRHQTLLVATACSDEALEGATLRLDYSWRLGLQTHQERLDVPAGGCVRRAVTSTMRSEIRAILQTRDGRTVARARPEYLGWWRSGIVLDTSLKGIVNGSPVANFMTIPTDVEVPPDAMAWSSLSYVVTRDGSLSNVRPNLRRAIEHWVSRGGTLVVAADAPSPPEPRGAGRVVTLLADETLPRVLEEHRFGRPSDGGTLSLEPSIETNLRHFWWGPEGPRNELEPIDPNVAHPPSSGLSWILLLGYVALVGPLSYRWLARKRRTLLAIGSVPASATLLVAALATHGLFAKGIRPRFRAIEVAEVLTTERTAAVRRTAGLVTSRPGWMRIESSPAAVLSVLSTADRAPRWRRTVAGGHSEGRRTVLETGPVGLWDTVFVAEGAFVDLGGTVNIVRAGQGFLVENRTARTIHGAVLRRLVMPSYVLEEWSLGNLPPGTTRRVDAGARYQPASLIGPPALTRGVNDRGVPQGVSLLGKLDAPLLPPLRGYVPDHETTWLQVVMP